MITVEVNGQLRSAVVDNYGTIRVLCVQEFRAVSQALSRAVIPARALNGSGVILVQEAQLHLLLGLREFKLISVWRFLQRPLWELGFLGDLHQLPPSL